MPYYIVSHRYVYHSSQWIVAGNTDHSLIATRLYIHPDSPCSGEKWMQQVISFDRVKLTNNERNESGHVSFFLFTYHHNSATIYWAKKMNCPMQFLIQIILQSMNKYKPRIHITMHSPHIDLSQMHPSLPAESVHTFTFPETQFTTVTAYQNQQVTDHTTLLFILSWSTINWEQNVKIFSFRLSKHCIFLFGDLRSYWKPGIFILNINRK